MLRSSLSLLVVAALVVAGCPVYDDGCNDDSGCGPGYVCHLPTRECISSQPPNDTPDRCSLPGDCDPGDTCDRFGRCRRESCGEVGCVSGYRCEVDGQGEKCVRQANDGGRGGSSGRGGESGATSEAGADQGGGAGG